MAPIVSYIQGMSITLRLDIDKPYGRASLAQKIMSKVREDYVFPGIDSFGYLSQLGDFLEWLNRENVSAISYHRLCTAPNRRVRELLKSGGHRFGLHAEDTRSKETLVGELNQLMSSAPELEIHSFTKHGSGELKLGRRHYAPYEPDKYRAWAREIGVPFLFGNGIAEHAGAFDTKDGFFPDMYWLEPEYKKAGFAALDQALNVARRGHLIVIIHPENLWAIPEVKKEFSDLLSQAKAEKIEFTTELFTSTPQVLERSSHDRTRDA